MPLPQTHACPKCGRTLRAAGEVVCSTGFHAAVFQCDECIDRWEGIDTALSFAVDAEGHLFGPDGEPLPPPPEVRDAK